MIVLASGCAKTAPNNNNPDALTLDGASPGDGASLSDGATLGDGGPADARDADAPDATSTPWPANAVITIKSISTTQIEIQWTSAPEASSYRVLVDAAPVATPVTTDATLSALSAGPHEVRIEASVAGMYYEGPHTQVSLLPLDPSTLVPPVDPSGATSFADATAFLYSGTNPIQVGVTAPPVATRASVVRGRVLDEGGAPLPGAIVSIAGHPEWGRTTSRADGFYDAAVEGGAALRIHVERAGYLPADRAITPELTGFGAVPDVRLVALDSQVTTISLGSSEFQVARGSTVTDVDGARRATLIVPPGTQAEMVLPDGTRRPLSSMAVRATEYTVGAGGQARMPATLPVTSAYTYAVELSADEALAAGAIQVSLSRRVPLYIDNFLELPVGNTVPAGYYDRERGTWVADQNGVVVKILSTAGGAATLDINGDNSVDTGAALDALGITGGELTQLASLYSAGSTVWRIGIPHFTPWDCNKLPTFPPQDDPQPEGPFGEHDRRLRRRPCERRGSIIECQDQVLAEEIPIAGTGLTLRYQSDQQPGFEPARTVQIPIVPPTYVPERLQYIAGIEVELQIAGRVIKQQFTPSLSLETKMVWDGRDAYGRLLAGPQRGRVGISYLHRVEYLNQSAANAFANTFGRYLGEGFWFNGIQYQSTPGRSEVVMSRPKWSYVALGGLDAQAAGIGGWELSAVHRLVSTTGEGYALHRGDGSEVHLGGLGRVFDHFAGARSFSVPATISAPTPINDVRFERVADIAVGPRGELYVANNNQIQRIENGMVYPVLGDGTPPTGYTPAEIGDGGPALAAHFNGGKLAIASDGSIYFTDWLRIRRVRPDGIVETVVGTGTHPSGFPLPEGTPATSTPVPSSIRILKLGPDGSVYYLHPYEAPGSSNRDLIRRLGTDGLVTTVTGLGIYRDGEDAVPVADLGTELLRDMEIASDGTMYLLEEVRLGSGTQIRRVDSNGMTQVLTQGYRCDATATPDCGDYGPARDAAFEYAGNIELDPSGILYAQDNGLVSDRRRVRAIGHDGIVRPVIGSLAPSSLCADETTSTYTLPCGDGGPGTAANIGYNIPPMAIAPDGSLYLWTDRRIRRLAPQNPRLLADQLVVPDASGREAYVFDPRGRHLRTVDAITGVTKLTIGRDAEGLVSSLTDADGNTVTIARSSNTVTFTAPGGQVTALVITNGRATAATSPRGSTAMEYDAGGLLTRFTDGSGIHSMTYDAVGRLIRDDGPAGTTTLARTASARMSTIVVTSPGGRHTTYVTQHSLDRVARTRTDEGGAVTQMTATERGTTVTSDDGRSDSATVGADPQWFTSAPLTTSLLIDGTAINRSRAVTLTNPDDPLSVATWREDVSVAGQVSSLQWNAAQRTFTRVTSAGESIVDVVDHRNHIVSRTSQSGAWAPMTFTYSAQGLLTAMAQGATLVNYAYDAGGLPLSVETNGEVVTTNHDAAGRLVSATYPRGTFGFSYVSDTAELARLTLPDGSHVDQTWSAGRKVSQTGLGGGVTQWTFDGDGQLQSKTMPSGRTWTVTADRAGWTTAIATPNTSSTFTRGAGGTLTAVGWSSSLTGRSHNMAFTRDANTHLTEEISSGRHLTYSYDAIGRLATWSLDGESDPITRGVGLRRTTVGPIAMTRGGPGSRLSSISDGVWSTAYGAEEHGLLASLTHATIAGTVADQQLAWSPARILSGAQVTLFPAASPSVITYGRDPNRWLTSVTVNSVLHEQYRYDSHGNRLGRILDGGAEEVASFDSSDRIVSLGGVAYTYDGDGFLSGRGSDSFVHSAAGQLLRATVGGVTADYTYDGYGRLVARRANAADTSFLYADLENAGRVTHVLGSIHWRLYYDDAGRLVSAVRDGERYQVVTDAAGTPLLVVDAAGAIAARYSRDAWGRLVSQSNPSFALPIGFGGGLQDPITGFVHLGVRDYDPVAGRFITPDPLGLRGGDTNLYAYSLNDPVSRWDPIGLWSLSVGAFEGVGGSVSIAHGPHGWSICGQLGVGAGGSFDWNPTADAAESGTQIVSSLQIDVGPVGVSADQRGVSEWGAWRRQRDGDCEGPENSFRARVGHVAFEVSDITEDGFEIERVASGSGFRDLLLRPTVSLQATVGVETCTRW